VTSPFLDIFAAADRPLDEVAKEVQEVVNRTGLPNGLGLANLANSLRPSPNTHVRTTHGLTLRTKAGRVIGAVQTMQTPQSRAVSVERQIDRRAHGKPARLIPQQLTTHTISIVRLDLNRAAMEEALGTSDIVVLTDQFLGLRLREQWAGAAGVVLGGTKRYDFSECFLTDLGHEYAATDDRISRGNCTLVWTDKLPIG
jgi:hypothetical protein